MVVVARRAHEQTVHWRTFPMEKKKWQATHIAPLQPPILAVFLPWGGSAGAGRVRPAAAKVRERRVLSEDFFEKSFEERCCPYSCSTVFFQKYFPPNTHCAHCGN